MFSHSNRLTLAVSGTLLVLIMAMLLGIGMASAAMAAPVWRITSVAGPSNFEANSPQNEVQDITVNATGGTFTLSFAGEKTVSLPYNATESQMESALDAIKSVNVTVTGGPGDATGSTPYIVTFSGGELQYKNVPQLTADGSSLVNGISAGSATVSTAAQGVGPSQYEVTATNVGSTATSGTVTIEDALPAGVEAVEVFRGSRAQHGSYEAYTGTELSCPAPPLTSLVKCTYSGPVGPGDSLLLRLDVRVSAALGEQLENKVSIVSGGGVQSASGASTMTVGAAQSPFGLADLFTAATSSQAGAHPDFTTSFELNQSEAGSTKAIGEPRDFDVDLPPGFIGDPLAAPRCGIDEVRRLACPAADAVGVATVRLEHGETYVELVYNITPYPDEPAAFAFQIASLAAARLDTSVIPNSEGVYAVHVTIPQVNESASVTGSSVTLWSVPADENGPGPYMSQEGSFGGPAPSAPRVPFLTNPTQCGPEQTTTLSADSWQQPGVFSSLSSTLEALNGCELLHFDPSFTLRPDTTSTESSTGVSFNLKVPQNEEPEGLATPDLRNATVTLPKGLVVNPSEAEGLQGCTAAQIDLGSSEPGDCPSASQIATVNVHTPLLSEPLEGQVFLGVPECSPCGNTDAEDGKLLHGYIQIEGSGVVVKLPGDFTLDTATGRITASFREAPQLPFDDFTLKFKGGPRGALTTPSACGSYSTTADLEPWSAPESGPDATPEDSFTIDEGCGPRGFGPTFSAGTTNPQAGAFSAFTTTFSRVDHEQDLHGVQITTPPGLLGMLSGVALCGSSQASAGTCGPESQIGETTSAVGSGPVPYWVKGGRVYLTGPYNGGPFGLSIVVPAVAGPFNLGNVIVRASIRINPQTAQITVVSDPLPQSLDGIPLQIKTVNVTVNKPGFMFNATNCEASGVTGTITSTESTSMNVSSLYQAANCASLPFKPSFTVSTQGKTSKADGASLDVKVAQRPGEADIHKVDLQLPLILPARLTTLQKACTEAQFNANPAGCPEASDIGTATARTPVLDVPLTGPAYLVSHGGAAFPDVEFVLQADERGGDVEIVLDGGTDIKKGITYSRFETVPDAPISSFETVLPEGPHSALAANAGLCGQSLVMPTTITGQNGAQVTQQTKITVTGCPKPSIKITKVKVKVKAGKLLVTVTTSEAGIVTIAGKGLKGIKKALEAGSHQLKLVLTKTGREMRGHHQRDKLKVTLKSNGASVVTGTKALRL
jgi:Domain of unknown function DUF11